MPLDTTPSEIRLRQALTDRLTGLGCSGAPILEEYKRMERT